MWILGGIIAFLAVAAIGVGILFAQLNQPPAADYTGEGTGSVEVVIANGATVTDIGNELTEKGVTASAAAFVTAAGDDGNRLQPGTYSLRQQMSASSAMALLLDPAAKVTRKITIPEGSRMTKVVKIASESTGIPAAEFEAVLDDPSALGLPSWANGNPEGFLYPATYEFQPGQDATAILSQMVAKFNEVAREINLEDRAAQTRYTPYEIVTIASLVEAEGTPEDFGKIARVVENRLDEGMPLQFDSTSNYASDSTNIELTDEQKAEDTPYNTYLYNGLTPTPIGQPGEAALEAALAPEAGPWLYFVSVDPDKKITKFTDDYQVFLGYVDEFYANLAKRGGNQ